MDKQYLLALVIVASVTVKNVGAGCDTFSVVNILASLQFPSYYSFEPNNLNLQQRIEASRENK